MKTFKNSVVALGNNIVFNNSTHENPVGIYKKSSIYVGKNANLLIGDNTGFPGVSLYCSKEMSIGSFCNFGGNISIWDTDFHPLGKMARRKHDISMINSRPIYIGDDVFIGANTIILKGVSIGDNPIVGVGLVVCKDIPSNEIWAGNPAKLKKET